MKGTFGLVAGSAKLLLAILCFSLCASMLTAQMVTPRQMLFKTSVPITLRSDRTGITDFDSFLDRLGAFSLRPIRGMHSDRYYMVNLTEELDWDAIDYSMYRSAGIEYIQPNRLNQMHLTPNDPLYPLQQHHLVALPQAWNYTTGSPLIVVGVIDSGILHAHPDLAPNLYINPNEVIDGTDTDGNGYIDDWSGWDFADAPEMADIALGDFTVPDNDANDENYHGTHVSGIIGAAGNNGLGIAGVCWNVRIMPIRAGFRTTSGSGYLQDDDAAQAIIYAADNGCHVINMSWGDPNYSPIIADAAQYAYDRGVTLIASAGNDPGPNLSYPAKLSSVISVGAVNRFKNIAGFSSYGVDLDIVAPGEQVLSTYKLDANELYMEMSGTSMSAPYVSGAAALLLSLDPTLSPQEVRSRLLNSADDLGATGVDPLYGHGLLNVRRMIETLDPPLVHISYPYDQLGVSGSFDIIGTVHGNDFFRYSVMYTSKAVPSVLDWYDVSSHTNQPSFYYSPVQNGIIASFGIMPGFPEAKYQLRIIYETGSGKKYHFYHNVVYDQSPPSLITQSLYGFSRYDKQDKRHYVSAKFTEKVHSSLKIIASDGSIHYSHAALQDSLQVWALPLSLPVGQISIEVNATNISNLSYQSPLFTNFMNISYELIPSHGFVGNAIGDARVPLNKMHDFSGNGIPEYVSMELPSSGYGNVSIFEPGPAGHIQKHNFSQNFWPLDVGNTNSAGMELLYLTADTARLMDTKPGSVYPDTLVWSETGISGGVLADYSGDGTKDILLVKNLPTARVIQAYSRSAGGTISSRNTIYNNTPTSSRNTFVPTVIVENFDNDSFPDILTADTDGDIMIYEIYNNNSHNMVWSRRLPVGNAYYMCAGDFDGNGRKDFMVGGYYRDILNPDMNFWWFEGFRNTADNSYASMGSVMFNDILSQNAISAYDLDGDGKDEIILAISPNLYVLKYIDGKFSPIWYGESFRTYQIASFRDANSIPHFITNAKAGEGNDVAMQWTPDIAFTGPPTPANFLATPIAESMVKLSWVNSGAQYYRISRLDEADNLQVFDNLPYQDFYDTDLQENHAYRYSIKAYNDAYPQAWSSSSIWHTAIPKKVPSVVSLQLVSSTELRIMFDQAMPSANLNPGLFSVNQNMGQAYSVNHIMDHHGFQLRFRKAFEATGEPYIITMKNLLGSTGVMLHESIHSFDFVPDTEAPRVLSTEVLADHRSVKVTFSEPMHAATALILANYELHKPSNDTDNTIESAQIDGEVLIVKLRQKLKSSNQAYYIVISELSDIAGNRIDSSGNIARFSLVDFKNLKNLVTYPNPVYAKDNEYLVFLNFPAGKVGKIKIFTNSGQLVYDSNIGPFNPVNNNITWRWNLMNKDGRKVSSGVYFYVVEMDGEIKKGKVAVIR